MKLKDTFIPWKISYDQPRQHIQKQRNYLLTKVHLVKAMVFPVVMYGCESWTLKSLLQHHSSKTSILRRSGFFTVQLSHPYTTTGKTIALTRRTFVGKVMSLLFNILSRLVITFLPRSKHLLISWLQSPSAVIWEPRKIKSATVSTVSPSTSPEVMGPDAIILVSECWALSQHFHSPLSLSSRGS